MQKLRFLSLLILLPSVMYGQQRTKIILRASEEALVDNKTKITHVKKPIFDHDGAILTCDSARLWSELNYFEAFGNVHINQGDTINIYSDLLNYDGNAKIAHLNNNVRMSDPSSTLTTNIFDYNMATKVGTYIQNGKIENPEAVITSKKGYYLARTKDAYFKYDVVVVTDQATIKSDTLRYNTFTNQTYFYGPTNIKGKDDNLYTENGEYNTKTENAFAGKRNLYTQGSKTLKGDSLYYNGKRGYGKAVKNIIFTDSEDKLLLRGQLGEYYKEGERIIVKDHAYVGMGTSDSVKVDGKLIPDTLWLGADVLEAQMTLQSTLKLIAKPVVLEDDEVGVEEEKTKVEAAKAKTASSPNNSLPKTPTTKTITKPVSKTDAKQSKKERAKTKREKEVDSVKIGVDSTILQLKILAKKDSLFKDSIGRDSLVKDSLLKIKKQVNKDSLKQAIKIVDKSNAAKTISKKDSLPSTKNSPIIGKAGPLKTSKPFDPADTVRTRTIRAHHNVRVFKTNLQAKSDSLFFTAADSTLRLYQNPILWSDSSQQTGDTIHVQFKNKKINSAQILQNSFIVDQEADTTKFNQIKGKIITVFFNDGEIRNMYVDGNAESIYFDKKTDGQYQQNQTISARIRIIFVDKDISRVKTVKGIEGTFSPAEKTAKDAILTGFIWKPELRPKSKNDIVKGSSVKRPAKAAVKSTKPAINKSKTTNKKTPVKPNVPVTKVEEKLKVPSINRIDVAAKTDSAKVAKKPLVVDTTKKTELIKN